MRRSIRAPRPRPRYKLAFSCAVLLGTLGPLQEARAEEPMTAPTAPSLLAEKMAEARRQFEAGVNLLDDPDGARYEQAYRAFKKAYDLSQSPKVLGNVAFCAMKLERDGEAIDSYATYLREVSDIDERERLQIQRDIATLTATVARLNVAPRKLGATFVVVDRRATPHGGAVENHYALAGGEVTLRVRPGRHTILVKAMDGTESTPVDLTLEPGERARHEAVFPPPARPSRPDPSRPRPSESSKAGASVAGPLLTGTAGLLAIGAGIASGLLAQARTRDIEARCPNNACPSGYDFVPDRGDAKTLGTISDVSFVGGGVLVGGALLWYALLPGRSASRTPAGATKPGWGSSWSCTGRGCGLQLERGF